MKIQMGMDMERLRERKLAEAVGVCQKQTESSDVLCSVGANHARARGKGERDGEPSVNNA